MYVPQRNTLLPHKKGGGGGGHNTLKEVSIHHIDNAWLTASSRAPLQPYHDI